MTIKETYDSDEDDVLTDFYIPVLTESTTYDRLAGFFSSTALAISARGLSSFIMNGGKMRLVTSTQLSEQDLEAIKTGLTRPEEAISKLMIEETSNIADEIQKNHVAALAWMVAQGNLEIKIAIPLSDDGSFLRETLDKNSIYHQKVGILKDEMENTLSFSGSINETGKAWIGNIEEFKVFRNWVPGQESYCASDIKKFEKFWNDRSRNTKIFDMPTAVKEHLITLSPPSLDAVIEGLEKGLRKKRILLRNYQNDAVTAWIAAGKRGIFEMATGTGKTYAAIACIKEIDKLEGPLLVVITCPYTHLIPQWQKDLRDWGLRAKEAFSSSPEWRRKIGNEIIDLNDGLSSLLIILTTHDTFSNDKFAGMIEQVKVPILLIADEVHAVGSEIRQEGLLEKYDYRLGLSATPRRYFDDEGTLKLLNYFGPTVMKFDLADAIREGFLVPYEYHPHYVELTESELRDYREMSKKIAIQLSKAKDDQETRQILFLYQIMRQKIIVNAEQKLIAFQNILSKLKSRFSHCLVYCSERQISEVQETLNRNSIINQKITFREKLEERGFYLRKFDEGFYRVLVAINCLDEGVNIPAIETAIILASTGNPKQYIQRRGRILRKFEGKTKAILHDVLVIPTLHGELDEDTLELERKIVQKELARHEEMANIALNREEAFKAISRIKKLYGIE
ncbi:MAG: DEAD/DEAH box helicase family protein [Candidatus Nitrosotenuis sp.]